MKAALYTLVICGGVIAAGCGQKGALYLPDKNAAVVTRPGGSSTPAPQAPDATTAPALPAPNQGSSQQTPQNRAPEPPPPPTSEGTTPKPPQDKDKDKDDSKASATPRN
jgi:predicted small lipoprotein YifL